MSKVRLIDKNSNWGGVLNLSLDSEMTTNECLDIVKKLDDISQNKFYTINIWDIPSKSYKGNVEVMKESDRYVILSNRLGSTSGIHLYHYIFHRTGEYTREYIYMGKLSDIISRLDKIEQQLGI